MMRGWITRLGRYFASGARAPASGSEPDPAAVRRGAFDAPAAQAFLMDQGVEPVRPAGADSPAVQPRHPSLCARPEVSVVLGSLDRVELLKMAIDSVRLELEGLDGEIIVIDGGSSDGALEWLAAQHDIITVVQHNRFEASGRKMRRRSWGGFMNIAFRAAASEHILMISDDCRLLPGAIRAGLDRMRQAREAGLHVGGCAFYFRNWPDERRYYVQRTLGGNLMVNHGLYSKPALEAIGFANEDDYVFYKSDTDLSLRLWRSGYAIIESPDSICEHYVGIAEALRETNNAVMEYDREQMRRFWPDLVDGETVRKMGKIELDLEPGDSVEALWRPLREAEQRRLDRTVAAGGDGPVRATSPRSRKTAAKRKPAAKPGARGQSQANKATAAAKALSVGAQEAKPKRSRAAAKIAGAAKAKPTGARNGEKAEETTKSVSSGKLDTPIEATRSNRRSGTRQSSASPSDTAAPAVKKRTRNPKRGGAGSN